MESADEKDLSFFEQQCSWFRYRNHDTNCTMGRLFTALSRYVDFQGLVACYSGNKSFHIHVILDPTLANQTYRLDDDPEVDLRTGFVAHWDLLKEEVLGILQPTLNGSTVEPDAQLRFPEWYRRLPGGTRLIAPKSDKPEWTHALGIPLGTHVPQVAMWQKMRSQVAKGASALFFRPTPFRSEKAQKAKKRNETAAVQSHDGFSVDEFAYIEERMREHYPSGTYPEFVGLEKDRGVWVARFRNGPWDRNPSSIMRHDHSTVLIMGQCVGTLNSKPLEMPLLAMMRLWRDQYRRLLQTPEEAPPILDDAEDEDEELDLELVLEAKHIPGDSSLEADFTNSATSLKRTRKATRNFFKAALEENRCLLVKGPEGSGKSSSLMRLHNPIVEWLADRRKPTLTMYAFTDYLSAAEKCEAFNQREEQRRKRRGSKRYRDRDYQGVVLKSFSQVYKEARAQTGYQEITPADAAQIGCKSVWAAVARHQPEVMDLFREVHRALWTEIGDATPVFFTVHAVAHTWRTGSPTRTMWARQFWDLGGDPTDWQHRQATELGLLVHDEVRHTDLIDIQPAEVVEWVEAMMQAEPAVWANRKVPLREQHAAYDRYRKAASFPVVRGEQQKLSFDTIRSLVGGGMLDWCEVALSSQGAYPDSNPKKLLYTTPVVDGHRWMVRPKYWWRDHRTPTGRISQSRLRVADRVIILTTEELPTAVIGVADPICWKTFALETPDLGRDVVDVELDRSVTASKIVKTAQKHRERLGDASMPMISNKAKVLQGVQTPISARGSNEYIGKDVLQTMMFMSPEVHEEMLVLNAYTGRDDCVLLHHMDAFNQSCGRNLGYRRQGNPKHHLLVNLRLFDFLIDAAAFAYARYDIVLHLSKKKRVRVRSAAPKQGGAPSAQKAEGTPRDMQ